MLHTPLLNISILRSRIGAQKSALEIRTSRTTEIIHHVHQLHIRGILQELMEHLPAERSHLRILDIGCGYNANKFAKVVCDIQDLSNYYQDKEFIRLTEKKLPFKDKEFDFVVASHVIEHVQDVDFFIKEIERVSKKGYIELPTMLEDNLVFENKNDHIWHMDFDDVGNRLLISKKIQYFHYKSFSKYPELNQLRKVYEGFKKANGKLFPFGFIHILKAFKKTNQLN